MVYRYRNGQSVPLSKPLERYSSAVSSFISNLPGARSREGQKEIGDRTESVKWPAIATICLSRGLHQHWSSARGSSVVEGLQTALDFGRSCQASPSYLKKLEPGRFESGLKVPDRCVGNWKELP